MQTTSYGSKAKERITTYGNVTSSFGKVQLRSEEGWKNPGADMQRGRPIKGGDFQNSHQLLICFPILHVLLFWDIP